MRENNKTLRTIMRDPIDKMKSPAQYLDMAIEEITTLELENSKLREIINDFLSPSGISYYADVSEDVDYKVCKEDHPDASRFAGDIYFTGKNARICKHHTEQRLAELPAALPTYEQRVTQLEKFLINAQLYIKDIHPDVITFSEIREKIQHYGEKDGKNS